MRVHLGAPAGGAVGARPPFGPRLGQDSAEGPTAVGPTPDALHHVTWDAVLVVSHLPLRAPAPQPEVEDGGDLAAPPGPRGEGAGEERVERLDGDTLSLVSALWCHDKASVQVPLPSLRPSCPPAGAFPPTGSLPRQPLPSALGSASAPPRRPMADRTLRVLVTSLIPSPEFSEQQPG